MCGLAITIDYSPELVSWHCKNTSGAGTSTSLYHVSPGAW